MLHTSIPTPGLIAAASDLAWSVACYFIADFLTGFLHWAEDTWTAPGRSKLLDKYVVLDNLEHHARPGSIRGGSYLQTNGPSIAIAAGIGAVFAAFGVFDWQVYFTLAVASQGNQVHKWAHSADRPAIVALLQSYGILQSRSHHGRHHSHPFAVRFCALSDYLNPVLDRVRFWRGLEFVVQELGITMQHGTPARRGL